MNALQEKSFRGWPTDAEAGSLDIRPVFSVTRHGILFSVFDFTSQPYLRLRLYLTQSVGLKKPNTVTLNVLDEQQWTAWLSAMRAGFAAEINEPNLPEPNEIAFEKIQKVISSSNAVFAYFAPRRIGPTAWKVDQKELAQIWQFMQPFMPPGQRLNDMRVLFDERKATHIRRLFMLLGQTLDGMRVWDVRRAIQTLRSCTSVKSAPIVLKGREQVAGIILYASLFEGDIARLDLSNLPHSHQDGPDFLNVLRYLDIPQALAMAAERSSVHLYQTGDFQWRFPRAVIDQLSWPHDRLQVHKISAGDR